jgi:zinc protease
VLFRSIGNVIPPSKSPDTFPFLVLNQVLGGTTGSRLFMNLRESKGYAYYVFSGIDSFRSCGVFWIRARVTSEAIHASVQEILKELDPAAIEKIPPGEIEQAKSFLIGNYPLRNQLLDELSMRVARNKAFNLDDAHWDKYYENIIQVNSSRVLESAGKCLKSRPVIIVVGNQSRILDGLQNFDRIELYDLKGHLTATISKGVEK